MTQTHQEILINLLNEKNLPELEKRMGFRLSDKTRKVFLTCSVIFMDYTAVRILLQVLSQDDLHRVQEWVKGQDLKKILATDVRRDQLTLWSLDNEGEL